MNLHKLIKEEYNNIIKEDDSEKESDIQSLVDIIDTDPYNPKMDRYKDNLKNKYNYKYIFPEIRYKEDINIINEIINKKYKVKTNKGFEFTFITKKPNSKDLLRTVWIEMFDQDYNKLGQVGFNVNTFEKSIIIGGAKVFDQYKRKGIYSAVVDYIEDVAKKYNLNIVEGSRSSDAKAFWNDRINK
jgi:3'-phosphoadenosine 5'-phosphosulfate sulfotransferase (PAPS reductase)/FAD synthetase